MPERDAKGDAERMRAARRYDAIGRGYVRWRRPDPRIEARIRAALGEARTVVNVGAGTGSYEPDDRPVLAVEPSLTMIAQRRPGSAPVVRGRAERLPLRDGAFDAGLALLTLHHWADWRAGLAELRRVARRCVVFHFDPNLQRENWFAREYAPAAVLAEDERAPPIGGVLAALGGGRIEPVPVPHDCSDGFFGAWWRRPHAYLDSAVREGISSLARLSPEEAEPGLARLAADLESGAWHERFGHLLERDELDLGYRLVVSA